MQVESWECDLKVPNLPSATLMPGAALLGLAYYYLKCEIKESQNTLKSAFISRI
jgi:hypothetical protein